MIDYIKSFEFNSMLAIFIYWVPLAVCALVYTLRAMSHYKDDLKKCTENFYRPKLTLGLIVWGVVVTVTPVFNLFAAVFDCGSSVFRWLIKTLDMPLVRARTAENKESSSS